MTGNPLPVNVGLATADYRHFDWSWGVPIQTTVGKPRRGPLTQAPVCNEIAPYGVFNVQPKLSDDEFRVRYLERLDRNADRIDARLAAIAADHPGEQIGRAHV